jgi:hypothetical protein
MGCSISHHAPSPIRFAEPTRSALKATLTTNELDADGVATTRADAVCSRRHSEASSDFAPFASARASVTFSDRSEEMPRCAAYLADVPPTPRKASRADEIIVDPFVLFDMGPPPPGNARLLCAECVLPAGM